MVFRSELNTDVEGIGKAAWSALLAASWATYNSFTCLAGALAPDKPIPMEMKLEWARLAFENTASLLADNEPYRTNLLRYLEEEVPVQLARLDMPRVTLKL